MELKYYADIKKAKAQGIEYKLWNNRPSYLCPQCQYDDLNFERLVSHIKEHSKPRKQVKKRMKNSRLCDRFGNKLKYSMEE
jgi:hypothetical protein